MAFDYEFVTTLNGQTRRTNYQSLIRTLGLENEIVHGRPMSDGGTPQALFLKQTIEKLFQGATVQVFYNGNQIL